jgi:hypothetical protein
MVHHSAILPMSEHHIEFEMHWQTREAAQGNSTGAQAPAHVPVLHYVTLRLRAVSTLWHPVRLPPGLWHIAHLLLFLGVNIR